MPCDICQRATFKNEQHICYICAACFACMCMTCKQWLDAHGWPAKETDATAPVVR